MKRRKKSHGWVGTSIYRIWADIIQRCTNTTRPAYSNYGGRGITVCERWKKSFEDFLADVGERPSLGHSLDRIDNDGNYEAGNVRWATRTQQMRNARNNIMLTHDRQTRCVAEWAELLGVNRWTLYDRLDNGWTVEEVLTVPIGKRRPRR